MKIICALAAAAWRAYSAAAVDGQTLRQNQQSVGVVFDNYNTTTRCLVLS